MFSSWTAPKPDNPKPDTAQPRTTGNLTSHLLLNKIDRLREAGVGAIIPLPQLVVVGDQSSGKSSVLESLTGFYFPRAIGLCTRYATQITCIREPEEKVIISIIPRPHADDALKARLLEFRRTMTTVNNDTLASIFEEANAAMGIRMSADDAGSGDAFSQDILKIEISSPDQNHLTVIDVPGIFRVPTPGLTTESDISLIRKMVEKYMENTRTIILPVIPCNVDFTTQEILKLAEKADPSGVRTMVVMTKPDLATEDATQSGIMDLLTGRRNRLKLGYHVVKNRGADDKTSTLSKRSLQERQFFKTNPWSNAPDRCGVPKLQDRLSGLLVQVTKGTMPQVKAEVEGQLRQRRAELDAMGIARCDPASQRLYLVKLATRFRDVTRAALNGYYSADRIFEEHKELKLITKIMRLNERFADVFALQGHMHTFGFAEHNLEIKHENDDKPLPFDIPLDSYPELSSIMEHEHYQCPDSTQPNIFQVIEDAHNDNRGPELGTFNHAVLAIIFQKQTQKWKPLTLSHISKVVCLVHEFVSRLLALLCPEPEVRDKLWDWLVDHLCDKYKSAIELSCDFIKVERSGRPMTLDHYFKQSLQKKREDRLAVEGTSQLTENKANETQTRDDILDTLTSYYKVSRKRFVDVVCQHVVFEALLEGDGGPLGIFCPEMIMGLDDETLEAVAGEDADTMQRRKALKREIESLEEGVRILRS